MSVEGSNDRWNYLINALKRKGIIRSDQVERALSTVPRDLFVPENLMDTAYNDRPLPIGNGQTISAPHMVAIMAEEIRIEPGMKILEIGTGSGYHAAVISHITGEKGRVFSIERIHSLVIEARRNLSETGIENVTVVEGDGSIGLEKEAPYDRIYYTCAAPEVPGIVKEQVKDGGIILAVVGPKNDTQQLIRYDRKGDKLRKKKLTYCMFVPLLGEKGY
ncbi:MAG: protein-L-isoaspartate(D-aspartate) O-methyltransferase [Candidatus Thermoplasmatota archaeon]|nr:protein-L-isoaspartate(D-aspartate) O-methyltransferase [Candidatus Thermoplasmatota archaeon]